MITEITKALLRADLAKAAAILEQARRAPSSSQPSAQLIAYFGATGLSYQGDYQGATKVMREHAAKIGPTRAGAFDFHDAMIALRTADGDLIGALVECEEMVKAGVLGTWRPPESDRMTLIRLKEYWHRAYLLRMIAQTRSGEEQDAFMASRRALASSTSRWPCHSGVWATRSPSWTPTSRSATVTEAGCRRPRGA